jgi:glycosyltransferase involved in cell wall biosynthesis
MKKILFVTYDFPYPTNTGGKNRAYHMLKHTGSDIKKYLFSFVREDFRKEYEDEMDKIGVEIAGVKKRRKLSDPRNILGLLRQDSIFKTLYFSNSTLSKICSIIQQREIDIVHFETLYTAFFINPQIKKLGVKQIFGTENIEFEIYEDYVKNKVPALLKPLFEFQVRSIKKEEIKLFKTADLCIAVSDKDAGEIKKYASACEVVRNGVDLDEFKFIEPKNKHGKRLLFIGNFTYFPNVDAINYFYKFIFKNLKNDITLTIIGKKVKALPFVDDPRIESKEFVSKIADEYEKSDIVVSPLRLGGGTNFKVLEAMAKGVPVISFPNRLEGLDYQDGENIVVVNNDLEFINKIKTMLNDLDFRKRISKEARQLVEREYSWKVIGKKLAQIWNSL